MAQQALTSQSDRLGRPEVGGRGSPCTLPSGLARPSQPPPARHLQTPSRAPGPFRKGSEWKTKRATPPGLHAAKALSPGGGSVAERDTDRASGTSVGSHATSHSVDGTCGRGRRLCHGRSPRPHRPPSLSPRGHEDGLAAWRCWRERSQTDTRGLCGCQPPSGQP